MWIDDYVPSCTFSSLMNVYFILKVFKVMEFVVYILYSKLCHEPLYSRELLSISWNKG